MTRRERILLGAACLTIAYGAYGFVNPLIEKEAQATMEDIRVQQAAALEEAIRTATEDLRPEDLGPTETRVMALLRENRDRNAFLDPANLPRSVEPEKPLGNDPPFEYSGYLQVGGKAFALINGVEYQVGEELAEGGYALKRATPDQAVVVRKGDSREIVVLFKDGGAVN